MSKQSNNKLFSHAILPLSLSLLSAAVQADGYHYDNILIGDRASGMGGAYTAVADDPSGLYYNPAGIVYTTGSNVSGSMNAFHITNATYKDVLGGNLDWKRESSALLPNFFGVYQPFWKGKLGFSYAVLDSVQEDQDQTFSNINASVDEFTININNQDTTYNIGPSFAMQASDHLSVGLTLYGHMRTNQRIFNQVIFGTYDPGSGPVADEAWSNKYDELSEYGIRPVLGIMWSPLDTLSIGLNLNRTFVLSSSRKVQENYKCAENPDPAAQPHASCVANDVIRVTSRSDASAQYPFQTRLGLAYFPSPTLLLSGDMIFNSSTDDGKEAVINLAFGGELYVTPQWALRAGLFTNKANTPTVETGKTNQLDHVDMLGGSFSLTRFTRNSALTAGFSYAAGDGKAQVFPDDVTIYDVSTSSLTMFLSATYSY